MLLYKVKSTSNKYKEKGKKKLERKKAGWPLTLIFPFTEIVCPCSYT